MSLFSERKVTIVTSMRWSEIGDQDCSIARALSVVGDRWSLLILREAFVRTRRFDDFQARTGAPRPVLAERLKTLVDHGVSSAASTRSILSGTSTD